MKTLALRGPDDRFSKSALHYREQAKVQREVANRLAAILPKEPVPQILELGAGTGFLTSLLLAKYPGSRITACDSATGMLRELSREIGSRHPSLLECLRCNLEDLSVSGNFDLAVSSSALHWSSNLERSACKLGALLHGGASLYAAVMVAGTLRVLREVRHELFPELSIPELPTGDEVLEAFEDAGFHTSSLGEEELYDEHASAWEMLRHLSALGVTGGRLSRSVRPLRRSELARLCEEYENRGPVRTEYRVLYLRAIWPTIDSDSD